MKDKKFHLGWFMNFTADMWTGPFEQGGGAPWDGQFYVEMAKNLERAGFDFIMMEDKLAVSEAFGAPRRPCSNTRSAWCPSMIRHPWRR